MEAGQLQGTGIGSVKAAISSYGERVLEGSSSSKRPQAKYSEKPLLKGERNAGNSDYAKVMRELESVKQELSKLKLDMASILDEKRRSEKEIDSYTSKTQSLSASLETLSREIDEINEETVLVELAKIEALKEYSEIEAQRQEAKEKHLSALEETKKKVDDMVQEVQAANELEKKLAITMSDIDVLQNVKEVKKMDKTVQRDDQSGSATSLEAVMKELEEAKSELALIKDESFQFMSSMDVVRNEIKHVKQEAARIKKKEDKADLTIQNLNTKLLRAKAKLESVSSTEDKAKSIASNLSVTLENLKAEAEAAKKERTLISEEMAVIKAEVQRTDTEIDLAEEQLQGAFQDLKLAKVAESEAMENLKGLIEKTMRNRASTSQVSSMITISKFEYDYLTGHASGAEEIADKKIAAAQAWVEALKASEKEILIKAELARRETRELKVEEELEVQKTKSGINGKKTVDKESSQPESTLPRKCSSVTGKTAPARRGKALKPASPGFRSGSRSKSFTVRRRTKVPQEVPTAENREQFIARMQEKDMPGQSLRTESSNHVGVPHNQ